MRFGWLARSVGGAAKRAEAYACDLAFVKKSCGILYIILPSNCMLVRSSNFWSALFSSSQFLPLAQGVQDADERLGGGLTPRIFRQRQALQWGCLPEHIHRCCRDHGSLLGVQLSFATTGRSGDVFQLGAWQTFPRRHQPARDGPLLLNPAQFVLPGETSGHIHWLLAAARQCPSCNLATVEHSYGQGTLPRKQNCP